MTLDKEKLLERFPKAKFEGEQAECLRCGKPCLIPTGCWVSDGKKWCDDCFLYLLDWGRKHWP